MDKFIVDAGPLIHLDQIGQLKLLKKLSLLIIPQSIVEEIRRAAVSLSLRAVFEAAHTEIAAVSERHPLPILQKISLQRGEMDCIRLALERAPSVFLTDDLGARMAAEKFGIEVHGSVGLIVYGVKQKWIDLETAEEALDRLYHQSSLFVTHAIIERAIHALRKAL